METLATSSAVKGSLASSGLVTTLHPSTTEGTALEWPVLMPNVSSDLAVSVYFLHLFSHALKKKLSRLDYHFHINFSDCSKVGYYIHKPSVGGIAEHPKNGPVTLERCQDACKSNDKCNSWMYVKGYGCFLRPHLLTDTSKVDKYSYTVGPKTCDIITDKYMEVGRDYRVIP